MPSEPINIPIKTSYDDKGAKKALDDVKKLDSAKPKFEVDADTRKATKAVEELEEALEDTRTAGQRVADQLAETASKVDAELTEAKGAADALANALGPELAGKADMGRVIADLQRMGLSFDDIRAEADQLAASLKAIDHVETRALDSGLGQVKTSLGGVRGEADNSRSVLANMVGNSAQDLGALGGVAGGAGVALGQLAEYATEGNISLSGLAKVAGPMLGLGVALELMNQAFAAAAASKAFDAANVKQYFEALSEGTDLVNSFNEEIRETGELQFRAAHGGGPLGIFSSTKDLLPILERANVDVAQFNTVVEDYIRTRDFGADANDRWRASLEASGISELDAIAIVKAARQEAEARIDATERDARVNELLGETALETGQRLAQAQRDAASATEFAQARSESRAQALDIERQAEDDLRSATEAYTDSLKAQIDAMVNAADANIAATEAQENFIDAAEESAEIQADGTKTTEEKNEAVDAERDALIDAAKAQARLAEEEATAAGKTLTATQKVDGYNSSLLSNARYATPAARQAAYEYLIQLNDIPPEKATEILAAVAAGDLDTAERLLNETSRARTVAVTADAHTAQAESEIQQLIRARNMEVNVKLVGRGSAGYIPIGGVGDRGGMAGPGGMLIAERGEEIFRLPGGREMLATDPMIVPSGTQVTSRVETERIMHARADASSTNVVINMPRGSRPDDVMRAADRYARRNGRSRARR